MNLDIYDEFIDTLDMRSEDELINWTAVAVFEAAVLIGLVFLLLWLILR